MVVNANTAHPTHYIDTLFWSCNTFKVLAQYSLNDNLSPDPNQTCFCSQWGSSTTTRRHSVPDRPATPQLRNLHILHIRISYLIFGYPTRIYAKANFCYFSFCINSSFCLIDNLGCFCFRVGLRLLEMLGQDLTCTYITCFHHAVQIHPLS